LGVLSSLTHEVLSILHKPVWVTRWSIPTCDHDIKDKNSLEKLDLNLLSSRSAVNKMLKYYEAINDIARDEIFWFYGGLNKDVYSASRSVCSIKSKFMSIFCNVHQEMASWNEYCFMGIGDYKGSIKNHVFSMLEDLIYHE